MTPIKARDISFRYSNTEKDVLSHASLDIQQGEFIGIIGPSGCGKSTLCYTLNGIIPHTITGTLKGSVEVFGHDTSDTEPNDISEYVGIVLQNPETQLFAMTVEEELAFGPENLGIPPDEIRERIAWALSVVGMEGHEETFPFNLSGGQKQRIAIAASLTMLPKVMLLDEPTSQLDPKGKRDVFNVINSLHEEMGMSIVLVEHETDLLAEYADRIIVMQDGEISREGNPTDILSQVEFLHSVGIRPPEVAEMTYRLYQEGLVDRICTTLEQARELIL